MDFLTKLSPEQLKLCFDESQIIAKADAAINITPPHITDDRAERSMGGPNDFYSDSDYWWPDPDKADGLPYIRRDGETNPDNFNKHRASMRIMRTCVANLTAGYCISENEAYANKAVTFLREFFLDEETKMNPHMLYAQAVAGLHHGRAVGVIDTLHLIDVPVAIGRLKNSSAMTAEIYNGLRKWFEDYLHWMSTHEQGIQEMNARNNHGVCWNVQAAMFAKFTQNTEMLEFCKKRFVEVYFPNQMAQDGSFPHELARTKPYSYSCFIVDNMVNVINILSTKECNLWEFSLEDGRCIKQAVEFIVPYMEDISTWPYNKDVQYFEEFPAAMPFLLFAGVAFQREDYLKLWAKLAKKPQGEEVRRNIAIRQPYIWLI